jgi:hypothetical protein
MNPPRHVENSVFKDDHLLPATDAVEQASSPLDAAACSAWRDPKTDPPSKTGKILVWLHGVGPSLVNVEERWMAYWNGHDETCPADPDEWDLWAEINKPNVELSDRHE